MTPYSRLPLVERLARADLALTGAASDPDMAAALAAYGYDADRLAEGRALYQAALDLHLQTDQARGEQTTASEALKAARAAAYTTYLRHVKLARVALKGQSGLLRDLGLLGPRARREDRKYDQARNFYRSALAKPEALAALAALQMTEPVLTAGLAALEAVNTARVDRHEESEESQTAKDERDAAMEALDRWMGAFYEVARVCFAEEPQRLERLGITVSS